jgi:hypothetical protein
MQAKPKLPFAVPMKAGRPFTFVTQIGHGFAFDQMLAQDQLRPFRLQL